MYKNLRKLALFLLIVLPFNFIVSQTDDEVGEIKAKLQEYKPGSSLFLLRGYAHSGLEFYEDRNSFVGGSFNPIFLWRQSKSLLFEAELELELVDSEVDLGLDYANMSYFLTDYITLRLGYFLVPFGTFAERLHPRWINRLPSNPLGFSHDAQVGPASQLGAELRGALPVFSSSIVNYSFYVINGPELNDGSEESEEGGMLHYDNFADNNKNKTVGTRVGILPFSDASLEIGLSGQFGKVGSSGSIYEDVGAQLYAADLSYVKTLGLIKSIVDIKAQWSQVNVDDAYYVNPGDTSAVYTFKNRSHAYYGQLSIRPAFVDNNFFRKLEFVTRYSGLEFPEKAVWGAERTKWTFGINYWLDWRTVIKIAYETTSENGNAGEEDTHSASSNAFLIHWSIGF